MAFFKKGDLVTVLEKHANYIDKENLQLGWASPNMDDAIGKNQIILDIITGYDVIYYCLEDRFKYPENILCLTASYFFDIGDYVKIVRFANPSETTEWGWGSPDMTETIGLNCNVVETKGNYSRLDYNRCWYHNNTLELVYKAEPVQQKEENISISTPCKSN